MHSTALSYERPVVREEVGGSRRKPLIMVVEDHEFAREALGALLCAEGYDVIEAGNGREALASLTKGPRPDLILLDLMMPVMDGWEFIKRQRADWRLCTIPTIVITGIASHDPRCMEMPLVRFLSKPYTAEQLIAAIAAEYPAAPNGATA
jgi:CheY-like chemotaxis protein